MRILVVFVMLLSMPAVRAQDAEAPVDGMSFAFEPRPEAQRPPYVFSVSAKGFGRYVERAMTPDEPAAAPVVMQVSAPTLAVIEEAREAVEHAGSHGTCETKHKGIAKTGQKSLTFYKAGQSVTCTFEYSDDERVNRSAAAFQAMVETLQFGERLDHAHRFDRLGLDAEMDALVAENRAGRAIELQNIRRTLQSLVDDERVMERVRAKAGALLQAAGVDSTVPLSSR
jgi:hypothetical protein